MVGQLENSKIIDIHQSFWGEVNHGHGLIATSLKDDTLNQELSSFSDRPGSTYGQSIQPYFSGKKIGNYFVFTKSYPDVTSNRTGMVFTHALIINIDDISQIENIDFVFSLFEDKMPEKPTLNGDIKPIQLEVYSQFDSKKLYPQYFQKIVHLLAIGKLPIIFSGKTSNFIFLIVQIWKGLFPFSTIRKNLMFQIAFTPNDIQHNKNLSFIFVPDSFIDKWTTHIVVDDKVDSHVQIENEVERLLLGDLVTNNLYTFIQDLDILPESLKTISICHRAYNLYKKLKTCNVSEALQLVRSLASLSSPNNVNHIRSKSLERLCFLLPDASEEEIKGLRNIDFSTFEDGNIKIVKSIEQFLEKQFQNTQRNELSSFILDVFETKENVIWWHQVIIQEISQLIKYLPVTIIWNLINTQNRLLAYFEPNIDCSTEKEMQFLSSCPQGLNLKVAEIIKTFARNRKWFRLFAKMNILVNTLQQSLLEQISLEKDVDLNYQYSGLEIVLNAFTDVSFIEFAVKNDIEKLNHVAAEMCIKNPILLSRLDVQIATWRKIWVYSLEKTNNLTLGISNVQSIIFTIYDLLIQNNPIDDLIIEKISKSEYANIKNYPNRQNLWNKIPLKYQSEFISKTMEAIMHSILIGNDEKIEPIIIEKILSQDYLDKLFPKTTLKSVLFVYNKLPNLGEDFLLSTINKSFNNLDNSDADRLGELVKQKGWQKSADAILEKAKNNDSFRSALGKCSSLISWWNKFLYSHLFNDILSESDYYRLLYELVIKLYDRGPEENDIWKRSGGDVAIFSNTSTRQEQWHTAIKKLQIGGGGKKITTYSLLEEIKKDNPYKYYKEINKLMEYFKKK